jgi:hypothetical protein
MPQKIFAVNERKLLQCYSRCANVTKSQRRLTPRLRVGGFEAMITDTSDDRFQYEGDTPSEAERWEQQARVDRADEILHMLREANRTAAKELHAIGMLDIKGWPPRGSCDSADEVIEGAADEANGLFSAMLDEAALTEAKRIADGEDE